MNELKRNLAIVLVWGCILTIGWSGCNFVSKNNDTIARKVIAPKTKYVCLPCGNKCNNRE